MFPTKNNTLLNIKHSAWHRRAYLNKFTTEFYALNHKTKTVFDLFLYSYIYKKFLNNLSKNHNYSKIYNILLKIFIDLEDKFKIKGFYIFVFFFFNLMFTSFFELTKVKVAGRQLKVPNPIFFNKSYRIIPKLVANILKKTQINTLSHKLINEINHLDQEGSGLLGFEKSKISEAVSNRMFENFRWKYKNLKGSVSRLNP